MYLNQWIMFILTGAIQITPQLWGSLTYHYLASEGIHTST